MKKSPQSKPKLVFFSPSLRCEEFMSSGRIQNEIIAIEKWLQQDFEVFIQSKNCDLKEILEKHNPDILLYDGMTEGMENCRFTVCNSEYNRSIPRAGLMRAPATSVAFGASYEYFQMHGVQQIFGLGINVEFADNLQLDIPILQILPFYKHEVLPISEKIRRIPISILGGVGNVGILSEWSSSVKRTLNDSIACLNCPDSNSSQLKNGKPLFGLSVEEQKASLESTVVGINLDSIGYTSIDSALKIAVSGALLVAAPCPLLILLGFQHGVNCLMPDAQEVLPLIQHLLMDRERLNIMAHAGRRLVVENHVVGKRNEIAKWLSGGAVIQESVKSVPAILTPTQHIMERLDQVILQGDLKYFERLYGTFAPPSNAIPSLSIREALVKLLLNKPADAIKIITPLLTSRFALGSEVPDPIHWSFLLLSVFLTRDFEGVRQHMSLYPDVSRRELDIVRWSIAVALDDYELQATCRDRLLQPIKQAYSIVPVPILSNNSLLSVLKVILDKNAMGVLGDLLLERAQQQSIMTSDSVPDPMRKSISNSKLL
jgi:hypothetical protein